MRDQIVDLLGHSVWFLMGFQLLQVGIEIMDQLIGRWRANA